MQAQILIFVFPAITLIYALLFATLWWADKSQRHVLAYSFGFAAMAGGVILNIFLLGGIGPLGMLSYHLMSMAGLIAIMWGTAARVGLRTPIAAYCLTVLITSGVLWVTSAYGERDAMRIAQNMNSALLLALTAQNLWHAGAKGSVDRAIIWVFAAFAAFGFTRPFLSVFSDQLFGPGEDGVLLLMSVHVLVLCVLIVFLGIALAASILADKQEKDAKQATQDTLTGLPTRGAFEFSAKEMLERAVAERIPVSLIVGDIDHFKRINDTYGHHVGDKVIAAFGRMIGSSVRPGDVAGRIGGEEFCILAWNCTEDGASILAERLRKAFVAMRNDALPPDEVISASFGVAQFRVGADYARTFEIADAALYAAKRAGRNCVVGEQCGDFASIQPAEVGSEQSETFGTPDLRDEGKIVSLAERHAGKRG